MLCFSPQIWASDNTDPIERLTIQNGISYLYPQSTVGAHVSAAPHAQTLRSTPLNTRGNVAFFGCLGYELDLRTLLPVEIKEIRMSPSIDTNDFNTKVKAAQKFLNDGNRVKVSVRFRGREMAHTNLGEKLLMDFAASCSEIAGMEKNPKLEGRFMAMFLTPKNSK